MDNNAISHSMLPMIRSNGSGILHDTTGGQQNIRVPIGNYFRRESFFSGAQYYYKGRYLLNMTFRRDASSNFPKAKQMGKFYFRWSWLGDHQKSHLCRISMSLMTLKLRASFG